MPVTMNKKPIEDRLRKYVKKTKSCWEWTGCKSSGYGVTYKDGRQVYAHRLMYEMYVSKIPQGLVCDHICRNRSCVNPKHIEIVSIKENVLRGFGLAAENAKKKVCKYGHKFTKGNTTINVYKGKIRRQCKTCVKIWSINRYI